MRNVSIDIAKGIGIILVILGHTKILPAIHQIIYSFHMPMFFIIAGYVFNFEKWGKSMNLFIVNRFNRLVLPYFIFQILMFYPLWYFIGRHFGVAKDLNLDCLGQFIGIFYGSNVYNLLEVNAPLWFLLCLFVSECLFIYVLKLFTNKIWRISLVIILLLVGLLVKEYVLLPWSIDVALVMQPFILIGFYSKKMYINKKIFIVCIMGLIVFNELNGCVDTSGRIYGNIFWYYINGLLGTYVIFCISNFLQYSRVSNIFSYIGKNTLTILMWHTWGFKPASAIFVYILHMNLLEAQTNYWIIYALISLSVCLIMIYSYDMIKKYYNRGYHL